MTDVPIRAGGRATEAGMSFQAAVATWCAAQLVADMPVGSRFGLQTDARPIAIQCETGKGLDDVVLSLEGGGEINLQCKTNVSLEKGGESALAKTIAQLVKLDDDITNSGKERGQVAAVLAVTEHAAGSLQHLESALRAFEHGEAWSSVMSRLPKEQKRALETFELHARAVWNMVHHGSPTEDEFARLARLFRVRRFGDNAASADWREASCLIGRRLYGGDDQGAAPLATLLAVSRRLIRSGALADRDGMLRELRGAGHVDLNTPRFEGDIKKLIAYSDLELRRLKRHTILPIGAGIALTRECLPALVASSGRAPLLVTGEPGSGKTGVLISLARQLTAAGTPVVFLAAERVAAAGGVDQFRQKLLLQNEILNILAAWPGIKAGVLVIDALDALRGGSAEEDIAAFIEDASVKLEDRWSVVASIRTFDLRNGRRFRVLAKGPAPDPRFAEKGLENVRHFHVPRLTSGELASAGEGAPTLRALFDSAPAKLKLLLANVFNLSIAAELLEGGISADSIRSLSTQCELLQRYEDERMTSQAERRAARATVETMISQRQLSVRAVDVPADGLDQLLRSGVAQPAGDLVSFAHHVLFDHIAGRFYLDWNNPAKLHNQLSDDPISGLLLGPALRFAFENLWNSDNQSREKSWQFLAELAAASAPDPIVVSVAIRTAAEKVHQGDDVAGLCALISAQPTAPPKLLGQLARFVDLSARDEGVLNAAAIAWADVAETAANAGDPASADGARVLLWTLVEAADLRDGAVLAALGSAARALLRRAWLFQPALPNLNALAIRLVTRTFGSDPAASRALLERILEEERLAVHAADEAPWLAEGVKSIIQHDPAFATEIYRVFFAYQPKEDGKTWLGGAPSRILALISTVQQDYEHARWQLKEALPDFLKAAPEHAVVAVIRALNGLAGTTYRRKRGAVETVEISHGGPILRVVDDLFSLEDWRDKEASGGDSEMELLSHFVQFLRSCPDDVFIRTVEIVGEQQSGAAVWARLLGVAAEERVGIADDQLWAVASRPSFTAIRSLARDAIIFLAAVYPKRSREEREAFERSALKKNTFRTPAERRWWRAMLGRFLSIVSPSELITPEMKALREEMSAANELSGNQPFIAISTAWRGEGGDVVDSMLRSDGVNLEGETVKHVREASRNLEAVLRSSDDKNERLAEVWNCAKVVLALLDRLHDLPEPLVHASWGAISNGVEVIAQAERYVPGVDGLPSLDELVGLVLRMSKSPYPKQRERGDEDESLSWGNWDVRVYAAISIASLARKYGKERPDLIDAMAAFLTDPEPTVRLQVAQRLNSIWEVARERMWSLFDQVSRDERNVAVLSFFVAGPIQRVASANTTRTVALLSVILGRVDRPPKERGRDQFCDAIGSCMARLYVVFGEPTAWTWLERWTADIVTGRPYLATVLHSMRDVFFFRYQTDRTPEQEKMQVRAMKLLEMVIEAGRRGILEARPHLIGRDIDKPELQDWRQLYVSADQLIDQAGSQLYFGSGAFRSSSREEDAPGLATPSAKKAFLADYGKLLDAIADVATPRTLHHLLETLAHLVDSDPETVFDKICRILLGPASAEGYQFESMAADELVKLVERYIADHRAIFESPDRRSRLIEIIELFARSGWPNALRLLYELPDLLR